MRDQKTLEARGDVPSSKQIITEAAKEYRATTNKTESGNHYTIEKYHSLPSTSFATELDQNYAQVIPDDAPEFSEEAMAREFSAKHKGEFVFVSKFGHWLCWDGSRWVLDKKLRALNAVRHICRATSRKVKDEGLGRRIASYQTAYAVERPARTELSASSDQWDTDEWLLNTPAGTIDLHDGSFHDSRSSDYITKSTSVSPGGECPRFLQFLQEISGGDNEFVSFLQRAFGYCLTGVTWEHAIFFGYGCGGNGKSVLMNVIGEIMGDYHVVASPETFTVSKHTRHLTEVARLRGARLVSVSETESGHQWAETRLKELTGGTPVAANFMRQDQFEFKPQFKPFITGNNKPNLSAATESMRRRFHLIPFSATFPEHTRDLKLSEKLREEYGGILSWAIEGCLEWQKIGLQPPQVVRDSTDEYFLSEDVFGVWLTTKCQQRPLTKESSTDLYDSYRAFSLEHVGEAPFTNVTFPQELARRGFAKKRTNAGFVFIGIQLSEKHPVEPPPTGQNDQETDKSVGLCMVSHKRTTRARREISEKPTRPYTIEDCPELAGVGNGQNGHLQQDSFAEPLEARLIAEDEGW